MIKEKYLGNLEGIYYDYILRHWDINQYG
jgi:hypothetical protein